jgi:predicted metal-dependent peptidase
MFRKGEREHELFNVAADIAINQLIDNLPEGGQFPETYGFQKDKSAETYYELLKQEQEKQEQEKQEASENGEPWDGPSDGKPDLTNLDNEPQTLDVHFEPGENEDDGESTEVSQEFAKSVADSMVKDAISQAQGNTPGDLEKILDFLKRKPKISWKKELRNILSSRNGNKIETIKRRNRRFPNRRDLRGTKVQKDKPVVVVGVDTSGSMDDSDVLNGLVEINEVIKNTGELLLIQIDTNIKGTQKFDKNNFKRFTRKGYGGTYMGACPEYIKDSKLQCDVLIMISDMYIENIPTDSNWKGFKKPVLWLSTSGEKREILKHHKLFDIHNV